MAKINGPQPGPINPNHHHNDPFAKQFEETQRATNNSFKHKAKTVNSPNAKPKPTKVHHASRNNKKNSIVHKFCGMGFDSQQWKAFINNMIKQFSNQMKIENAEMKKANEELKKSEKGES